MATDITRIGLEQDRRGALLFKGFDKIQDKAYSLLKVFGVKRTTRDDIVGGITNETAKTITEVTEGVELARKGLSKLQKHLPKKYADRITEPKHVSLILDIGVKMAEDTALMIDAGMAGQQVSNQARVSAQKIQGTIAKVEKQLAVVERELHRLIELGVRRAQRMESVKSFRVTA